MSFEVLPTKVLELPDPVLAGPPCPACGGRGVTGDRYTWPPSEESTAVLVVDVLCPECTGCGSADHVGCDAARHGEQDDGDDYADGDEDADGDEAPRCPSCGGRGWWTCQGFTDTEVCTLRMPCGCSEGQLTVVPAGSAATR